MTRREIVPDRRPITAGPDVAGTSSNERAIRQEGYRYEMIEGRVFVSPAPDMPHDDLERMAQGGVPRRTPERPDILRRVNGAARVFLPRACRRRDRPGAGHRLLRGIPDDRPPRGRRNWRTVSPFLVVEILSEDNQDKDLERNRRLYLEVASIREYWILDPLEDADRPSLIVYRPPEGQRWAARAASSRGGTYTTPMLPGFSLVMDSTGT